MYAVIDLEMNVYDAYKFCDSWTWIVQSHRYVKNAVKSREL